MQPFIPRPCNRLLVDSNEFLSVLSDLRGTSGWPGVAPSSPLTGGTFRWRLQPIRKLLWVEGFSGRTVWPRKCCRMLSDSDILATHQRLHFKPLFYFLLFLSSGGLSSEPPTGMENTAWIRNIFSMQFSWSEQATSRLIIVLQQLTTDFSLDCLNVCRQLSNQPDWLIDWSLTEWLGTG